MSSKGSKLSARQQRRANREDKRDDNVVDFRDAQARQSGPDAISWTQHDVRHFAPASDNQRLAMEMYFQGDDVGMYGAAGSGKTLLAVHLACTSLVNPDEDIDGILIIRSAVPGREIGFVPGTEEEKLSQYERPYADAFAAVFGPPTSYKHLKAKNKVQFLSTTAQRGVNWKNKVIIIEEAQNYTFQEIDTIMTRRHDSCRLIITGDNRQGDLGAREVSGLPVLQRISPDLLGMSMVTFHWGDCQRGGRVKSWLKATQHLNSKTGMEDGHKH